MTRYFTVSNLQELSPLEVHKLYQLRVEVFVHEQQTPYAEIEDIDAAASTQHILAWQRDSTGAATLEGCARLIDGPESQLGRVAVKKELRGSKLSDEIMRNSLRLAYEKFPERDVVLNAQEPLVDFYTAYGFHPNGATFKDSGVAHVPMVLKAGELERYAK